MIKISYKTHQCEHYVNKLKNLAQSNLSKFLYWNSAHYFHWTFQSFLQQKDTQNEQVKSNVVKKLHVHKKFAWLPSLLCNEQDQKCDVFSIQDV